MKKRYAAGLALALVGILSGCGQAETQPADNTISITPVERKTDGPQMDMAVKYDFAGNHADVNGMEFRRYIWDGSAWENEGGTFTVNLDKVEENDGTIRFRRRVMHSMRNISLSLRRRDRNREILYSLRNLLR